MKLDATFVRSLHQSRCLAIVKSTLALAAALKMTLVVEGIETAAQYHELLSLGCVTGQGYWYSRPKSYVDIKAWLLGSGTKYTELSSSY
jgi:EAL domain-containing protein (putative c-di-GMP-specific phosphodiesterase class I)